MKKSILIAAAVTFSMIGFSQTAEKSSESKGACSDKDKPACCAKGSKSSCADGKSTAAKSDTEMATPVTATEPKKKEMAEKKKNSDL